MKRYLYDLLPVRAVAGNSDAALVTIGVTKDQLVEIVRGGVEQLAKWRGKKAFLTFGCVNGKQEGVKP
jgi:hypothetical protein